MYSLHVFRSSERWALRQGLVMLRGRYVYEGSEVSERSVGAISPDARWITSANDLITIKYARCENLSDQVRRTLWSFLLFVDWCPVPYFDYDYQHVCTNVAQGSAASGQKMMANSTQHAAYDACSSDFKDANGRWKAALLHRHGICICTSIPRPILSGKNIYVS